MSTSFGISFGIISVLVSNCFGNPEYPVVIPQYPNGQVVLVPGNGPPGYGQNGPPPPGYGQNGHNNGHNLPISSDYGNNNHPPQNYPPNGNGHPSNDYGNYENSPPPPQSDGYSSDGVQKYGYPPKCVDSGDRIEQTECKYMVTIAKQYKTGLVHFKMSRVMEKDFGYVAVGISKDNVMDDDHIVECVKSQRSNHPTIYHSWSEYHSRPLRLADNANLIRNKRESYDPHTKILTCEYDRPVVSEVKYYVGKKEKTAVIDLNQPYTILMAVGETEKPGSDNLGKHGPPQSHEVSVFKPGHHYRSSVNALGSFSWLKTTGIMFVCMFAKIILHY